MICILINLNKCEAQEQGLTLTFILYSWSFSPFLGFSFLNIITSGIWNTNGKKRAQRKKDVFFNMGEMGPQKEFFAISKLSFAAMTTEMI